MRRFLEFLARSRGAKLAALAVGSWRFWAATALAAAAVTTVVLYTVVFDTTGAAGTYPYYRLVSNVGATVSINSNAVDRVLLMNADRNAQCFVDSDNFTGVTTASKTTRSWWEFLNSDAVTLTTYNLVKGTWFRLHAQGASGRTIWEFENCRGGNLNPKTKTGTIKTYQNLLPYNTVTAYSYKDRTTKCSGQHLAGTVVMQNTAEAQIVSSCLDGGIGTVYFDCVNGFTGYKKGRLAVEVAYAVWKVNPDGSVKEPKEIELKTDDAGNELAGQYVPPDDAHCHEIVIVRGDASGGIEEATTNLYGRCVWQTVTLTGATFNNGAQGEIAATDELTLAMPLDGGAAGSMKNFYRVWAPVQDPVLNADVAKYCNLPMRLRICRLDDPAKEGSIPAIDLDGGNLGSSSANQNGLIILDNIIASFPAMKAMAIPEGDYVPGGSSRNVIGWTGALSTKYPKIGEKGLTASAGFLFVTNAPPDETVADAWVADTTATMKYRMRYLSWTNDWQDIALSFQEGRLVSTETIALPKIPGDFEYYYDTVLDAPYYGYVDYSGTGYGTPGYSERITHVESRFDAANGAPDGLPSTGTDFFTRLREGKSDQLEYRLEMRWKSENEESEYASTNLPFYVASDRTWKTFVRTTTNTESVTSFPAGAYEFRIVGLEPACTNVGAAVTEIPWSAKALYPATAEQAWTAITLDATTGALMFQLVENADATADPSYTIVHASYQDFNCWSDAVSTNTYIGAFDEEKGKKSGTSSETREFPSELSNWTSTAGSNETYWTEKFLLSTTQTPEAGYGGYKAYTDFSLCTTPNGWQARNSQWACAKWRQSAAGGDLALQLGGSQRGSLEFVNTKEMPHGIDQYTLKARVAQAVKFDDFAYYYGGNLEDLQDYAFTVRAVLSTKDSATEFHGNGSVSVVGYYQPGEGCYEIRAERTAEDTVTIYLYKWAYDAASDEIKSTLLGRHATTRRFATESYLRCSDSGSSTAYYGQLFIRCTQSGSATVVEGGILNGANRLSANAVGGTHYYLKYTDSDSPLTFGAFGFGSVNCPAQIIEPLWYKDATKVSVPNVTSKAYKETDVSGKPTSTNPTCGSGSVSFTSGAATEMFEFSSSTRYKNWVYKSSRFATKDGSGQYYKVGVYYSVRAVAPSGSLELFVNDVSRGTNTVSGFQFTNLTFTVRNQEDSLLRLATTAKSGDIVVDDCAFTQWCASSYNDSDRYDFKDLRPTFACPEHYVYLNGYVSVGTDDSHVIALQPMRAKKSGSENGLLTIRAPLMDGLNDYASDPTMKRGVGLGMFSFTYRNADEHCIVRMQYREEEGSEDLARNTASADGWTDVATYDFSTMSATERAGGTLSAYYGLHDYRGVMRLLIEPQVVADALDETKNPEKDPAYGSIEITEFKSRDEPPVDAGSWWGWNLRTTDSDDERSLADANPLSAGLALALNNSVSADVDPEMTTPVNLYKQHLPFVQTPDFGTNIVGEIAFRARRPVDLWETGLATEVAILGAKTGAVSSEDQWHVLTNILVSSDVYERYSYKTGSADGDYAAFRLAVIGVKNLNDGVPNYEEKMDPAVYPNPQRVLIDEIEVSEAVRGKIRLFDVGAFRNPLDKHTYVTNIFDVAQQPMCEESWSVQCEVRAVQLEEEVLLDDTTEVYLHWFATNATAAASCWGYSNWKDRAQSGKLARISEKAGFVFRGSYPMAPTAIVEPSYESGTVVQYVLEVHYKNADGQAAVPYVLQSGDWTKPEWYRGVDYNAGRSFAAYTILDSVAYGYAWINEVNLYDGPGLWNDPLTNQFVEVAVPSEGNIENWELRVISGGLGDTAPFYTNTVVVFRDPDEMPSGVPSRKTKNMDADSKYVFITAGTVASCSDDLKARGIVDGPMRRDGREHGQQLSDDATGDGFTINVGMPIGLQLVRPSGIIEHEIVVAGTNRYSQGRDPRPRVYSATNFVARLRAIDPDGSWYFTGEDGDELPTLAMGVTNFTGVITESNVWAHITKTPGFINVDECIPSDHPHPQGTKIVLYAQLQNGYVDQTICDKVAATQNLVVYVPKGLAAGTNITYRVADWHSLSNVVETCDGETTTHAESVDRTGTVVITVAKNASNDVTVVATTKIRRDLTEQYGLTADNGYAPAVMHWLETGLRGIGGAESFANPGGEIKLAKYQKMDDSFDDELLSLTDMYWLDMDPTVGGSVLKAGMCDPPSPTLVDRPHVGEGPGTVVTNDVCEDVILGVMMKIWNEDGAFEPYAPYTLNGIEPGSSSRTDGASGWDSVTFKVTGYLANGKDAQKPQDQIWKPMRYFVFDENSFDANFQATIQVADPFWLFPDWLEYRSSPVYFRWALDARKYGAVSSELLRPDSTY